MTPFVAIYTGGNALATSSRAGAGYEILAIGDALSVVDSALQNRAFTVGGNNPTISLADGEQLVAGYLVVVRGGVERSGTNAGALNDYVFSGDALTGQLGGALNGSNPSNFNFNDTHRFNIGFEIVPEPSTTVLFGLGALVMFRRRR